MKYAFMSFSCPELTFDELLATAKRYGYEGIEPRTDCKHAHGVELSASAEQRATVREKARDSGIALCCLATSCAYADPSTAQEQVDQTLRQIDLAGDIGAARLRVFGGAIPDGISREEATDVLADSLSAVADLAQARGVIVCMETHDSWCNPEHVAEVLKRVNHPAIAANWDIMHPVRAGGATMNGAFQTLKPWIRHIHFHDGIDLEGKLQFVPVGDGIVDHQQAVRLLQSLPYDGFLSGEWIGWEPWDVHLPRELAAMKAYERK